MKLKSLLPPALYVIAVGVCTAALFFIIAITWIGYDVRNQCDVAKKAYGGDCVISLSALVEDTNRSFAERNSAIWALGQIGDRRALTVLNKYYTGDIPNREPWNGVLSQYEMKKAINLASGGLNISHIFWIFGNPSP